MKIRQSAFLAILMLALTTFASAQQPPESIGSLEDAISSGSKITWKKLVGTVFKGIREDSESGDWITTSEKTLRQIGTTERTILPAETHLTAFSHVTVRGDGKRYVVMLIEAEGDFKPIPGGGAAALAVFTEGSTEPQDVAEVKADEYCFLGTPLTLSAGPDDLFFVSNSHSNSSEGYLITGVFQVHGGRIRKIDEIFTLRARNTCGESMEEMLTWKTGIDPGNLYPTLEARVSVEYSSVETEDESCGGKLPPNQVFTRTYRFDRTQHRYIPSGGDMEKLDALNKTSL